MRNILKKRTLKNSILCILKGKNGHKIEEKLVPIDIDTKSVVLNNKTFAIYPENIQFVWHDKGFWYPTITFEGE